MCTKEIRAKFSEAFNQYDYLKRLDGEKSYGIRDILIRLFVTIALRLITQVLDKYLKE